MGREDRIRELREELARLEAEEKALQPWGVSETSEGDEWWCEHGYITLHLPTGDNLLASKSGYQREDARLKKMVGNLALFPLMVEALRRHAEEDRDAAYLLHQIEGKP